MSNAVVVYESPDAVRKDIEAIRAQVMEVLPSRVDPERFLRVVAKAVIENPKLMACTRLSLLAAVHEAAQLGLEPSGLLGSAYLVPYRMRREVNGKWQTVHEAKLIPGYRGLIDLARRSGEIRAIVADVWRLNDGFDYERTRQPNPIIHRPMIPNPSATPEERDRGPIVGAYMLAFLTSGYVQPEVMFYDEIEAIRKRSKAADDGPWVTDPSEMSRKTVVRRGSKYLPLTTEFRRALELDEEAEREALPPSVAGGAVNPATQLLLDRAKARSLGQGDVATAEGSPDTSAGENESSGGSSEGSSETETESTAAEGAPDAQEATTETESSDAAPEEANQETTCGEVKEGLGTCHMAPEHEGPHRSDEGVWPRAKTKGGKA